MSSAFACLTVPKSIDSSKLFMFIKSCFLEEKKPLGLASGT
jgi:hypothetical protein